MSRPTQGVYWERLGYVIRELRRARSLSQEQLGFDSDLHRNYVGSIERGEINPTFRILLQLAQGLGMRLSEIIVIYENTPGGPRPPAAWKRGR
ncbi:MAG: transcriptional regulator, family [Conexibacter sp.]|nr:transcriptional regulator, family [Conexibacter sp.]